MPARAILTFGIAEGDGEYETLAVTSREMMQVELRTKQWNTTEFFQNISITGLYRVAYIVLGVRGRIEVKGENAVSFDDFADSWSVTLNDPAAMIRRRAIAMAMQAEGKSPDEVLAAIVNSAIDDQVGPGEVDPTRTAP
jgi:hypothetical protein